MLKSTFLRVRWIGYEFLAMDKIFSWLKSHFPSISKANIYFFQLRKKLSGKVFILLHKEVKQWFHVTQIVYSKKKLQDTSGKVIPYRQFSAKHFQLLLWNQTRLWNNVATGMMLSSLLILHCKLLQPQYSFVQSKDCNANLITAIDSALSLTVIHYSQTTANVQLMTALIPKLDCNQL